MRSDDKAFFGVAAAIITLNVVVGLGFIAAIALAVKWVLS